MKNIFLLLSITVIWSCKTLQSGNPPISSLVFDAIEAENIHQVTLSYRLKIENPNRLLLNSQINNYNVIINGKKKEPEFAVLQYEKLLPIKNGVSNVTEISLHLILKGENINEDFYKIILVLDILHQYSAELQFNEELSVISDFPNIREPLFTITSIVIMQADLINTRFAANLRIENPNPFPMTLDNFEYKLYGDGLLWAQGKEKDILKIQSKGSEEAKLILTMNFINMKRNLLDQIIAMRKVNYRFAGTAEALVDIFWLPIFKLDFDNTGYSDVVR